MPKLIKDGSIVDDQWQFVEFAEGSEQAPLANGKIIIPLATYLAQAEKITARQDEVGVWIHGEESLDEITTFIKTLPLIAVRFPGFMDGRGFSTGRLLRDRFGFSGELRAVGSFIRDQLCYLNRCGFNAFSFSLNQENEIDLEGMLKSLQDFDEYYQASSNQPIPLFRRRA